MTLIEKLFAGLQYLLPQRLLSRLVNGFMRIRLAPVKDLQIAIVGGLAGVDWSESRLQDSADFLTFNDFFTRELADGLRPIDPDPESLVSPSDGRISQCGRITNDRILQAKGHHFSIRALLAHDPDCAAFNNGFFHTIYLSPRDYHRVHMPVSGKLLRTIHVPGRLFSVSPGTVRQVPNLFARNERLVNIFDTDQGPFAVIMIGAIFVSSMDTVWAGTVTPRRRRPTTVDYRLPETVTLAKGEEMGRFNMGSTVILLFPENSLDWDETLVPGASVQMGQQVAALK